MVVEHNKSRSPGSVLGGLSWAPAHVALASRYIDQQLPLALAAPDRERVRLRVGLDAEELPVPAGALQEPSSYYQHCIRFPGRGQ